MALLDATRKVCVLVEQNLTADNEIIRSKEAIMLDLLLVIGIILLVLWALGFFVWNLGSLLYIALVLAVILIIIWLLKRIFKIF